MTVHSIRVFIRPDCHLCSEALEVIGRILGESRAVEFETIDIESSDSLLRSYLERIPVVEVDGVEVSELEFDGDAFRVALGLSSGPPGQVA